MNSHLLNHKFYMAALTTAEMLVPQQMFAHILNTSIAGMPMICVVITNDFVLEPYKQYSAVMVSDQTEAEALALKRNAIIVTSDKVTQ